MRRLAMHLRTAACTGPSIARIAPTPLACRRVTTSSAFNVPMTMAEEPELTPNDATVQYPTREDCRRQARFHHEMDEHVLLIMAAMNDKGARRERFIREVMLVDNLAWPDAARRVDALGAEVAKHHYSQTLSQALGIGSVITGLGSIPLVFSYDTAIWFNERFVTADVPEARDLETWLEVGAWTWAWMEPPLGTLSFAFLAFQFARGRGLSNPLEDYAKRRRQRMLLERYSQYSAHILLSWAESLTPGQDYAEG